MKSLDDNRASRSEDSTNRNVDVYVIWHQICGSVDYVYVICHQVGETEISKTCPGFIRLFVFNIVLFSHFSADNSPHPFVLY